VHTFGGEIPHVPGAVIKNTYLTAVRLLSLQLQLFTASKLQSPAPRYMERTEQLQVRRGERERYKEFPSNL